jgi:hypothetical protein
VFCGVSFYDCFEHAPNVLGRTIMEMTMNSPLMTWLHVVPGLMYFAFFVLALVYVIVKRSDQSSAKLLAAVGLSMMLILHVVRWGFNFLMTQYFEPDAYIVYLGLFNIAVTVFHLLAWSLLIAAVFAGRESPNSDEATSGERSPVVSSNPYSPPAN